MSSAFKRRNRDVPHKLTHVFIAVVTQGSLTVLLLFGLPCANVKTLCYFFFFTVRVRTSSRQVVWRCHSNDQITWETSLMTTSEKGQNTTGNSGLYPFYRNTLSKAIEKQDKMWALFTEMNQNSWLRTEFF